MKNAKLLLTDSGGIQKEAFWLKTPCITLHNNTEWTETIQLKANYLTGPHKHNILKATDIILKNEEQISRKLKQLHNPFGNGKASQKIINTIRKFLSNVN